MGIINAHSAEWRNLKVGNRLTLTDEPAVVLATEGTSYPFIGTIHDIMILTEPNHLAEWRLFYLANSQPNGCNIFVLAKLVGETVKVSVLRDSPLWKVAKRSELVNHASSGDDILWLFSPPQNVDGFLASSPQSRIQQVQQFNFSGNFQRNAVAGDGKEWAYVQRSDREFHTAVAYSPARFGAEQMATISEYGADTANVTDPELVILEVGSKTNGTIRILTGAEVSCDSIYVK